MKLLIAVGHGVSESWVNSWQNSTRYIIDSAAFSGSAGDLRWFTFSGGNFNFVEVDGDHVADMQVFVNLTNEMFETDFVL